MRWIVIPVLLIVVFSVEATEVIRVPPWELHSSFWMCLHQTLMTDAMSSSARDLKALSAEEQATWNDAVMSYRNAGGTGDITFSKPMIITNDAISQIADDATEPNIDAPLAETLNRAAPIYRKHWWTQDDEANRFFVGYDAAMIRDAGQELIKEHERVYRTSWPERIRVYITPSAGPFGAYTMTGRAGGVITTMSSRDSGYQGLRALEMLLHESSHAIVNPVKGMVADSISAAAKKRDIDPPHNLWHAILFATSGELTRRYLLQRGVTTFVPSSDDLFTRAWPKYREPIEKYWFAYLSGEGTLEEAIDKIVDAIPN
ncbi:hypothetical protein L0244_30880 [bacterium]|nr:hypothetical protein [bacterium]